mmetsp:Transcript_60721/g.84446  ORF Transcript_60721/g.84446 Transcript_60721/m.84446 type:complete len:217 (-) Transcript_60721:110-760(-)
MVLCLPTNVFRLGESFWMARRMSRGEGGLVNSRFFRPSSAMGRAGHKSFSAQTPRHIISSPPTGAWPFTLKSGSSMPTACASVSRAAIFSSHLPRCKSAKLCSTLPPSCCRPVVPAPEASRKSWRRYAEMSVLKLRFEFPSFPVAICIKTVTRLESPLRRTSSRNCSKSSSPTFRSSTCDAKNRTSLGFSARPSEISIVSSCSRLILPLTPASSSK